jgi:hypothetical protein
LAKQQAKKTRRKPLFKGRRRHFIWLVIALTVVVTVSAISGCVTRELTPDSSHEPKAAIVDQLYAFDYPSQEFIEQVTDTLESYGFHVDLYQGDEVTVDFYRNLPSRGYKLIILRTHSGLIKMEGEAVVKTSLFTSEGYSRIKYVREQLNEELVKASVGEGYPFYFAIDSKFITNRMKGSFDDTVIIITGCSGLYFDDLAQAFTDKGASTYLAWNHAVGADYVDGATITLVKNLCIDGLTIDQAVAKTMEEKGRDPERGAVLKYYPQDSGNKTIAELINWQIEKG